ncbi:MAG: hypothetical protein EXS38_00420 [Opitutus sp.]|nr:hypothetical protein [Opitutus sp.]
MSDAADMDKSGGELDFSLHAFPLPERATTGVELCGQRKDSSKVIVAIAVTHRGRIPPPREKSSSSGEISMPVRTPLK